MARPGRAAVVALIAALTTGRLLMAMELDMELAPWGAVNDGVMGGVSTGSMSQTEHGLRFAGELSLENNGGFASVRRFIGQDLSAARGVRLRLRGDGRSYQFRLRQDSRFDGIAWRAGLPTTGKWQEVELRFEDFEPVFRGRPVPEAGPVVAGDIHQLGFMLADGRAGPFELEIRAIEFIP